MRRLDRDFNSSPASRPSSERFRASGVVLTSFPKLLTSKEGPRLPRGAFLLSARRCCLTVDLAYPTMRTDRIKLTLLYEHSFGGLWTTNF
jgi:hypothetical protein